MSGYEINEKDIQGVLRYLQVYHPENANHEFAEEMLRYIKTASRRMAITNPDALEELYDAFQQTREQ